MQHFPDSLRQLSDLCVFATSSATTLARMSNEIAQALDKANIRSMIGPQNLIDLDKTLRTGSARDVADIVSEVAGQSLSLASGARVSTQAALQALNDAQALRYLALREHYGCSPLAQAPDLVPLCRAQRNALLLWVDTGVAPFGIATQEEYGPQSDLNSISRDFLTDSAFRANAISAFVASWSIIEAGLAIFFTPNAQEIVSSNIH